MINCSIIIVNFNTRDLLKKCLESLVGECEGVWGCEVIVVDNGSSDGSVETIRESIKSIKGISEIKLIENKENFGFAKAVNQGIKQSLGETILLLNSDTQVCPNAIDRLLKFEKKVRPAIIGAKMTNPDGTIQSSVFNLPTLKRAIIEYWLGKKGNYSKYTPLGDKPAEVEAVSGGAMLISRRVVDKIGDLNERYFMYFEDLDFCRRAKASGIKIYFLPSARVFHEHGASGKNLEKFENQWRRLISSSKIYNGTLNHCLINFVIATGQKFRNITEKLVLK